MAEVEHMRMQQLASCMAFRMQCKVHTGSHGEVSCYALHASIGPWRICKLYPCLLCDLQSIY